MQIITHCGCGQSFSVDESLLGTTMQCPTCHQAFVVQAATPTPPQPFATNADHLQNRYAQSLTGPVTPHPANQPVAQPVNEPELLPLSPLPSHSGRTQHPTEPGPGIESQSAMASEYRPAVSYGPSKKKLWIGLGVGLGGAACLILLLLLLIGQFLGGRSRNLELTYLPSTMSQFFFCDVEGLMATESGRSMIDKGFLVRQYFGNVEKALQIDLEDIRTITVGYIGSDPSDTIRPFNLRSKRPLVNFDLQTFFSFCAVIRTKDDVQSEEIMAGLPMYARKQYEDKAYYCDNSSPAHAFAFPEPKVILFGTEPEIQKALGGNSGSATSMYNPIKKSDQIVFINSLGVDLATGAEQTGIAVTFGDEVTGRLWVEYRSAEQARKLAQAQQEMQRMVRNLPDSPALRKAKASGFMSDTSDPFGLGDVSVSGRIVTTEFSGRDKLVSTATSQQAVVGMLRPFARFGNRNFGGSARNKQPANRQPQPRGKQNQPAAKKSTPKTLASFPRYAASKGNRVDLLEIINPKKDQITGDWSFENQTLVNGANSFRPRFHIPYKPPSEYDLKVSFRQARPSGSVAIIIPNDEGSSFSWTMDQAGKCRFTVSPIKKNETIVQVQNLIKPNVIHTLIIQKRSNLVRAVFDGRILAEYKGSWGDLNEDMRTRLKNRELTGFACEAKTSINQIELIEVRGTGVFVD